MGTRADLTRHGAKTSVHSSDSLMGTQRPGQSELCSPGHGAQSGAGAGGGCVRDGSVGQQHRCHRTLCVHLDRGDDAHQHLLLHPPQRVVEHHSRPQLVLDLVDGTQLSFLLLDDCLGPSVWRIHIVNKVYNIMVH